MWQQVGILGVLACTVWRAVGEGHIAGLTPSSSGMHNLWSSCHTGLLLSQGPPYYTNFAAKPPGVCAQHLHQHTDPRCEGAAAGVMLQGCGVPALLAASQYAVDYRVDCVNMGMAS
jgi:hypothetical protein